MDPSPHWRVNSSFSPSLSRRSDRLIHSDRPSLETHGASVYWSSLSSHSKPSTSGMINDQYPNHQYSVSDGALPYFDSPSNNLELPWWTPPVQRHDHGQFSMAAGDARLNLLVPPRINQRQFTSEVSSMSPSPLSETSRLASSSKYTSFLSPRNFTGMRPFVSKPVYPLVYPVSRGESSRIADLNYHEPPSVLLKVRASPDIGTSSTGQGFRLSNASSFDFEFDGGTIDNMDHIDVGSPGSSNCSASCRNQKCGLCSRMLWRKSPWSSHRIARNVDFPISAVLACGHVFHADCLEETTPKSQVHEPPCPLCLKFVANEGSSPFSEPLHLALRSLRRNRDVSSSQNECELRRNQSQLVRGSSSMWSNLRKHLSFKVKTGGGLFGAKIFRKIGSTSCSLSSFENETWRLRFQQ